MMVKNKASLVNQLLLLTFQSPILLTSMALIFLTGFILKNYKIEIRKKNRNLLVLSESKSDSKEKKKKSIEKDNDKYNYDSIFN